jgi:exopolysaccharide biosynthesis polyprenyl glycosylphosphotransferase
MLLEPSQEMAEHLEKRGEVFSKRGRARARWLSSLFAGPLRLALAIAIMDFVAAAIAQPAAFIFCKRFVGVEGRIDDYLPLWVIYNILLILFISLEGGFAKIKDRRSEEELRLVTIGNILAIFMVISINFILTNYKGASSRYIFITGFIFSLILTLVVHFGFRSLLNLLWRNGLAKENLLIVGDSLKDIRLFLDQLNIQRYRGFNILGYVAENLSVSDNNELLYLGNFQELKNIHTKKNIDKVLFAMQGYSNKRHQLLTERLQECAKLNIPALVLSQIFNDYNFELSLDGYSGIISISSTNLAYNRPLYQFTKRCIDIVLSLFILLVTLPLWTVIIVYIKFHDNGPVFFRHRLIGKGGKKFQLIKFRTMVANSEEFLKNNPQLFKEFEKTYKLKDDPRVTRIGKWLRKSSLDELPQLINILKGDMSLVGPRPVKEEELERFGDFQNERVKIRPGLTGYWQVSGRSATSYEERVQMDKFYMRRVNIWMDLIILIKTPLIVLKGHGAV